MSTTYTIIFKNNRPESGKYGVFTSLPETDTSADVYSNVWMSYAVPINGTFQINTSQDYYAWVGTAPESPTTGTVVQTGDSALAHLGSKSQGGSVFPMVVSPGDVSLDINQETRTAPLGAFGINTGTDFNVPNTKYLLGLGKVDKMGLVAPTACILADNNTQTSITPIVKFYIGECAYKAGSVVDFSSATLNAAVIDFTSPAARGMFTVLVEHQPDGSFDVTFEDSGSATAILFDKATNNKSLAPISDTAKLRQLQTQLQSLHSLLESIGIVTPVGNPLKWLAKIGWPRGTDPRVAVVGATAIALAMIAKNYGCTQTTRKLPDGTILGTFKISANHKLESDDVTVDWNNAVGADKQKDGHKNLGITEDQGAGNLNGSLRVNGQKPLQGEQDEWVC